MTQKYIYISSDSDDSDFESSLSDFGIEKIKQENRYTYGKTPAGNYIIGPFEGRATSIEDAINSKDSTGDAIKKAKDGFIQGLTADYPDLNMTDNETEYTFLIHFGGKRKYEKYTNLMGNDYTYQGKIFSFQAISRADHYPGKFWIKGTDGIMRLCFPNESIDPVTGDVTYNIDLLKKFYDQVQILLSKTPPDKIEEQFANRDFWITAIWDGEQPESFDKAFSAAEKDILSKNDELKKFFEAILDEKKALKPDKNKIHIIISQIMRIFHPQETECIPPYKPLRKFLCFNRLTVVCFILLFLLLIVIPSCIPFFSGDAEYETVTEICISMPGMEKNSDGQTLSCNKKQQDGQAQPSEDGKEKENAPSFLKQLEDSFPRFSKIMQLFSGNDKKEGDSVSEKNNVVAMIGYIKQQLPESANDKRMNGNTYFLKEEKKAAPIQYFNMFLRFCLYALGGVLCFVVYLRFMRICSRDNKLLNQERAFTNLIRITWKLNRSDKQTIIKHFAQSSIRLFFNGEDAE